MGFIGVKETTRLISIINNLMESLDLKETYYQASDAIIPIVFSGLAFMYACVTSFSAISIESIEPTLHLVIFHTTQQYFVLLSLNPNFSINILAIATLGPGFTHEDCLAIDRQFSEVILTWFATRASSVLNITIMTQPVANPWMIAEPFIPLREYISWNRCNLFTCIPAYNIQQSFNIITNNFQEISDYRNLLEIEISELYIHLLRHANFDQEFLQVLSLSQSKYIIMRYVEVLYNMYIPLEPIDIVALLQHLTNLHGNF